jgi:hypothetical protein
MIFLGRRSIRLSLPLLIGAMLVLPSRVPAHTDYSAGKTPEQLFDSDCSGCHHSRHRLAHGRNERSLTGFLREHYTTNAQWAASLASYLIRARASNSTVGATSNWFLKMFRKIWRAVSATSWWLIGQLAKLLHVQQSKTAARVSGTESREADGALVQQAGNASVSWCREAISFDWLTL